MCWVRPRWCSKTDPNDARLWRSGFMSEDGLLPSRPGQALRASKEVVRSVNLEVHPSEVVGLLGPNGAGKDDDLQHDRRRRAPSNVGESLPRGPVRSRSLPMYRRARLGNYLPAPGTFDFSEVIGCGQHQRHSRDRRARSRGTARALARELLAELGLSEKADRRGRFAFRGGASPGRDHAGTGIESALHAPGRALRRASIRSP